MTGTEKIFLFMLLCNTLGSVSYGGYGLWKYKKPAQKRQGILLRAGVMLVTPVIGPAFFLCGQLIYYLFFREAVDLEDVIFSKERVRTHKRADQEQEGNLVPLEEALAICDTESLRTLVLNVVRGDVSQSLASLALALNSEDTETSHYAAAVLRDVFNDFRQRAQELYILMQQGGENGAESAARLIVYMNGILAQGVFPDMEQRTYAAMMEEACRYLLEHDDEMLKPEYLEWLCDLLSKQKDFETMRQWCLISRKLYPGELLSYTCYLKFCFMTGKKQEFFEVLEELKRSDVVIDSKTLELIRTFS